MPRFAFRRDGRWIQSGLRVEHDGEAVISSRDTFPSGGEPQGLLLPERLGGGYLFFQSLALSGASATALYHGETWTGALRPLLSIPFAVQQVHAGFDRIYLFGTAMQIALDPRSGEVLPLDPLPPVVTIEGLAFSGSQALISAPLSGVLWTPNAGMTWQPLAHAVGIEPRFDGLLVVQTDQGPRRLTEDGQLTMAPGGKAPALASTEPTLSADAIYRAEENLVSMVSRGLPLPPSGDGAARFLSLGEGRRRTMTLSAEGRLSSEEHVDAVVPSGPCLGAEPGGRARLFLCTEDSAGRRYRLVSFEGGKSRSLRTVRGGAVLSQGVDAFVLRGDCTGEQSGSLCWVTRQHSRAMSWGELADPVRRGLVALAVSEQRLDVVDWSPTDKAFSRWQWSSSFEHDGRVRLDEGQRTVYPIEPISSFADGMDGATLVLRAGRTGEATTVWLTSGDRFVGVGLGDDGALNFGALQRPLGRALLAGRRAVIWGAAGFAKQSVDGGVRFREIRLPFRSGDAGLASPASGVSPVEMGCGVVGCVLGPWVRWGWAGKPLPETTLPAPRPLPPRGGGRARWVCGRGDVVSPPRRAAGSADFPSFWDRQPPAPGAREDGFSVGFPHDVARLYALGPPDPAWANAGRLLLRFVNPYDPARVRETQATVHAIDKRVAAEELLGVLDRTSSRSELSLDVGRDAGLVFLRTRGERGLFRFEDGGPLVRVPLVDVSSGGEVGLSSLAGTAFSDGRWFFGYTAGRSFFVVAEARDDGVSVLAHLPLGEASARGAQLVRTDAGDLGVAMEGDPGLIIVPVGRAGQVGDPLLLPHRAVRPPACDEAARGFLVDRELSLAPYLETPSGSALSVTAPRALLRVEDGRSCIEGLTARSRAPIRVSEVLPPTSADRVPLTLLSSDSNGARVRLTCQ